MTTTRTLDYEGASTASVLSHTANLVIGAHPDDIELLGISFIGQGATAPVDLITGVICSSGRSSARAERESNLSDEDFVALRRKEQTAAARLGGYAVVLHMALSSARIKQDPGALGAALVPVVEAVQPKIVVTHNPADKHLTHVRVAQAVVTAVGNAQLVASPRVLGVEIWRGLDWLPDSSKVLLDTTGLLDLSRSLLALHETQVATKRYDVAAPARLQANATFLDPYHADEHESVAFAMDLTPATTSEISLVDLVSSHIEAMRLEVLAALGQHK